jgi:hypothetical protein
MSPSSTFAQFFPPSIVRFFAAVDRVDNAVFEVTRNFLPAAIRRPPDDQPVLRACIQSNAFAHEILLVPIVPTVS